MKVIADCGHSKFLIEATDDEIAQMMGRSTAYVARSHHDFTVGVGLTIKVHDMWKKLKAIESIPSTLRELDKLSKSVALAVETHAPLFEQALDTQPPKQE